jgi:N-acetylneuraminic acid mutarotase
MSFVRHAFSGLLSAALMASAAQAHFLWIVPDSAEHPQQAHIYFSEEAAPDDPELLPKVSDSQVWILGGRREKSHALELKLHEGDLTVQIPEKSASQPLILQKNYGVISRGDGPFLLKYYAKTYPSVLPGSWEAVSDAKLLPFEIIPEWKGSHLDLEVRWQGKPVAGSQVTLLGPGIDEKIQGETDEKGHFACPVSAAGLYSIRARMVDSTPGELDGKAYQSAKHYTTLSLRVHPAQLQVATPPWTHLPQGTTSFGAGIVGNDLYVYGGHYGQAHHYSQEGQSGDFRRLSLKQPGEWESLPGGPKLTGLAMVAYRGQLYRVGGFAAKNQESEEQQLWSQPDFARFDPAQGAWQDLPPLPEGRSSHDIAVLGHTLYVVGGWEMKMGEKQEQTWLSTAWSCDLDQPKLEWKPVASPPFLRRAISLAAYKGKLYAIGGMQEKGGPTTQTAVFDPATSTWSEGPALLGTGMDGFGTASFAVNDRLYVTTMSGSVQRLNSDGSAWEFVGQLNQPRFFHEMIPWQDSLVIVGGASMSVGKLEDLEQILVESDGSNGKAAMRSAQ